MLSPSNWRSILTSHGQLHSRKRNVQQISAVNYAIALRFFVVMLTVLSVLLATFVVRRDPLPVRSIVRIDALPRLQWPSILVRTGTACLIASFVLILMICALLCA
jgi:hypothetical protein